MYILIHLPTCLWICRYRLLFKMPKCKSYHTVVLMQMFSSILSAGGKNVLCTKSNLIESLIKCFVAMYVHFKFDEVVRHQSSMSFMGMKSIKVKALYCIMSSPKDGQK